MNEKNYLNEWIDAYTDVMNQIKKLCTVLDDDVAAKLLFKDSDIFNRIAQDMDLNFQVGMILVSLSSGSYSESQLAILKSFQYADYMEYFGQNISWDELWDVIDQEDGQELINNFIANARNDGVFIRLSQLICLGQSVVSNYSVTIFMQFINLLLVYNNAGDNPVGGVAGAQSYVNTLWQSAYRRMEEAGVDLGLKIHIGAEDEDQN